jgi:hypothetical protein
MDGQTQATHVSEVDGARGAMAGGGSSVMSPRGSKAVMGVIKLSKKMLFMSCAQKAHSTSGQTDRQTESMSCPQECLVSEGHTDRRMDRSTQQSGVHQPSCAPTSCSAKWRTAAMTGRVLPWCRTNRRTDRQTGRRRRKRRRKHLKTPRLRGIAGIAVGQAEVENLVIAAGRCASQVK